MKAKKQFVSMDMDEHEFVDLRVKKFMQVRFDHNEIARRVVWYDPCEPAAIDSILRSAHGLRPDQPYLLLDENMSAVAISSSLPSGCTFELVPLPAPSAPPSRPVAF